MSQEFPSKLQEVTPGLWEGQTAPGEIAVFRLTSARRPAFDMMLERIAATLAGWPPERPYLALYDLSEPRFPSSYGRARVISLAEASLPVNGRFAIVGAPGFAGSMVRLLVDVDQRNMSHKSIGRIFYNRSAALGWLRGFLDAPPNTPPLVN